MLRRGPLKRFLAFAERPPSRPRQVLTVLLGAGMTFAVWDRRGAVAGLVALIVYGVGGTVVVLEHERVIAWSRRHPRLDTLTVIPLAFLALAYLTRLPLMWCALAGVALWVVLLPPMLAIRRRAAAAAQPSSSAGAQRL